MGSYPVIGLGLGLGLERREEEEERSEGGEGMREEGGMVILE